MSFVSSAAHILRALHHLLSAGSADWQAYGAQAVVVSIDPRRVYVKDPAHTARPCVKTALLGPEGQEYCWWQCTVKVGPGAACCRAVFSRLATALQSRELCWEPASCMPALGMEGCTDQL